MADLKLTNNPCKYCNREINEGKPMCGRKLTEAK